MRVSEGGRARAVGAGRIRHHGGEARPGEPCDAVEVGLPGRVRRLVDAPVAGVEDAHRLGLDAEGQCLGGRVGDLDRMQGERLQRQAAVRGERADLHTILDVVALEVVSDALGGELGRIDARAPAEVRHQRWQTADVVVVGVGDDDRDQAVEDRFELRRVGDHDLQAGDALRGHAGAGIHQDPSVRGAVQRPVGSDGADAADGHDDDAVPVSPGEGICGPWRGRRVLAVGHHDRGRPPRTTSAVAFVHRREFSICRRWTLRRRRTPGRDATRRRPAPQSPLWLRVRGWKGWTRSRSRNGQGCRRRTTSKSILERRHHSGSMRSRRSFWRKSPYQPVRFARDARSVALNAPMRSRS